MCLSFYFKKLSDFVSVVTQQVLTTKTRLQRNSHTLHWNVCHKKLSYSRILIGSRHELLEDRRRIDVIVTKFFPPGFKMAERFETLDNILRE